MNEFYDQFVDFEDRESETEILTIGWNSNGWGAGGSGVIRFMLVFGIIKMTSSDYYGRNFIIYGDAKGGDFAIRSQGRGLDALYTFNHSATSNSFSGFWSQIYHNILQANNLLLNIEKIEADGKGSVSLSDYKGQALTARALMYFDLVRLYGKPYNLDKES